MREKIIGVTVGTPISISKIENELKPVKTVNNKEPDEQGNVNINALDVGAPSALQFDALVKEVGKLSNLEGSTLYEDVLSFTSSMVMLPSDRTFSIQPAVKYHVYWNGVMYECYGKTYDDQPYLGNGRLVHGSYVEDTGEPFGFIARIFSDIAVYVVKSNSTQEGIAVKITTATSDETIRIKNGILSVNTAKSVEENNDLPITSAAVHTIVGNIEGLMKTI
jgi:hypothetical protein